MGWLGAPDSQQNIDALKKADSLVVGEIYPDELASIPLNLWAAEHRYVKLQTNILGI